MGDIFCWSHVNKTFLHNSLCGQLKKKCSADSTAVSQLVHLFYQSGGGGVLGLTSLYMTKMVSDAVGDLYASKQHHTI